MNKVTSHCSLIREIARKSVLVEYKAVKRTIETDPSEYTKAEKKFADHLTFVDQPASRIILLKNPLRLDRETNDEHVFTRRNSEARKRQRAFIFPSGSTTKENNGETNCDRLKL